MPSIQGWNGNTAGCPQRTNARKSLCILVKNRPTEIGAGILRNAAVCGKTVWRADLYAWPQHLDVGPMWIMERQDLHLLVLLDNEKKVSFNMAVIIHPVMQMKNTLVRAWARMLAQTNRVCHLQVSHQLYLGWTVIVMKNCTRQKTLG